jgi:molybdopterin molybdotransferase
MSDFVGKGRAEIVTPDELTPFAEYRAAVLAAVTPLEAMYVKTNDALGLVLAEDVVAPEPLPSFANSAMDGYAVIASDVQAATIETPAELQIIGEVAAGHVSLTAVVSGTAMAIMTGAQLPMGADAVVAVERTSSRAPGVVSIHVPPQPGANVRTVGQDVSVGTQLLTRGTRIGPADIALLSALGMSDVLAVPTPRVVVLSTGDELVSSTVAPGPGQLRDSNGPMVRAMVRQAGGDPYPSPLVGDDRRALAHALDSSTGHADLIVTTGGVSAGAHDHLEDVVRQLGEAHPHKVAMQPGMPQLLGTVGNVPLLGLPGNPVSTFVSFELFVRPAIRRLQGRTDLDRPRVMATLTEDISSPLHKRSYVRVSLAREGGCWRATPSGHQGSHVLSSLARADGLAMIDEQTTTLGKGLEVIVHLLVDA